LEWFFVYYGYSKTANNAYVHVSWKDNTNELNYENAKHYYPGSFTVYYGRDRHYPGFNGFISNFNFNAGEGAFVKGKGDAYNHPQDIFGFGEGL
jgi:hypothetical protein